MPFGGNDWLALTPEAILEPELPLCDPHHHFWDLRRARVPYQTYMLPELNADIHGGHNVRSTVFIECSSMYRPEGPEAMRPVGEAEFVNGIAAASASGTYGEGKAAAAIVGHANLDLAEGVQPVLEALQAASPARFRGIRHSVTWDPHPEIENNSERIVREQLATESFRAGARVLAKMGLTFDAWMFFHQLPELADFARAIPDLKIVINHIGGLLRIGPYAGRIDEVMATWRANIAAVAQCPNVYMKLGGIGMPRTGFDWHLRVEPIGSEELATEMTTLFGYCIEHFGPERCMFQSNFPVDKVSYSYNVLWNAFKRMSTPYSPTERAALLHDTAVRFYNITE